MKHSVEETLSKLAYVSDSLNKSSDSLSEQILEVESALQRYGLGVSVWVMISSWEVEVPVIGAMDTNVTRMLCLGYGKYCGKWGLLVSQCDDDVVPSEGNVSFLREASRDVKLEAVGNLPDLLKALLKKATEVASEATAKAHVTREIAASQKKYLSGPPHCLPHFFRHGISTGSEPSSSQMKTGGWPPRDPPNAFGWPFP